MKRMICILSTTVVLFVAINGCKKSDNNNGSWTATVNNLATSGTFVNASYFSANEKLIVTLTPSVTNLYPALTLEGITDTGGVFNLNGSSPLTATYIDTAGGAIYYSNYNGSGQFDITSFTPGSSNKISGSFSFDAHDPINDSVIVTNGTFSNINLIVQ